MMPQYKQSLANLLSPLAHLSQLGQRAQQLWCYACLKSQLTELDPSVVVLGPPEIHGTRHLTLGKALYLYRELYFETQQQGYIELGDEVVLSRGVHIVAFNHIYIGKGSMIGEYTSIRDANHRFGIDIAPRHSGFEHAPIHIGEHVWIGRGACILPGVTIGDGAVVGANAVVTHDVASHSVVAGVPAKALARQEPNLALA